MAQGTKLRAIWQSESMQFFGGVLRSQSKGQERAGRKEQQLRQLAPIAAAGTVKAARSDSGCRIAEVAGSDCSALFMTVFYA